MSDPPVSPVTPRPSASILLLRPGTGEQGPGLEVLMAKRSDASRFMPGVWVFPGGAVDPGDGELSAGAAPYRACARRELAEETGIAIAADAELVLFARWITPAFLPIRFDAWFFVAQAPPASAPVPDGGETTDARWLSPAAALEAGRHNEMDLAFPTLRKLEELEKYETVEAVLNAYRDRPPEAILPVPVESEKGTRLSLPGDRDYPS